MSVTVIATGIGGEDRQVIPQAAPRTAIPRAVDPTFGGKVRDITPADLARSSELDEPTFIRRRKTTTEKPAAELYREYKGIVIDNDDLDVPTFLRRKAD
jgi:cell division protein FtsZ